MTETAHISQTTHTKGRYQFITSANDKDSIMSTINQVLQHAQTPQVQPLSETLRKL